MIEGPELAKQIREWRESKRLNQEDLGKAIGLTQQEYSRRESNGSFSGPELIRLGLEGFPVNQFFHGTSNQVTDTVDDRLRSVFESAKSIFGYHLVERKIHYVLEPTTDHMAYHEIVFRCADKKLRQWSRRSTSSKQAPGKAIDPIMEPADRFRVKPIDVSQGDANVTVETFQFSPTINSTSGNVRLKFRHSVSSDSVKYNGDFISLRCVEPTEMLQISVRFANGVGEPGQPKITEGRAFYTHFNQPMDVESLRMERLLDEHVEDDELQATCRIPYPLAGIDYSIRWTS